MRRMLLLLLIFLPLTAVAANQYSSPITVQIPPGKFITLNFHDVRDDVHPDVDGDQFAISTRRLAAFFDWMRENGWHPISVEQIIKAHYGKAKLPRNAVLLSFDDGLKSVYTKVFPLLKAYGYPAMVALETGWLTRVHAGQNVTYRSEQFKKISKTKGAVAKIEQEAANSPNLIVPGKVKYNGRELGAEDFVSWAEAREMAASGLVEFATHTNHLHHGILANPQGNREPATITRLYNPKTKSYETDAEFHARIRDDLERSVAIIKKHIGVRPRAIVWPYGAFNREVATIAASIGLNLSFGLDDTHADSPDDLGNLGRFLIMGDPTPVEIEQQVEQHLHPKREYQRAIQVDLDYIYDPDPKQTNINLGHLLDRIKAMHIRTVYLQAFADPDGDGTADALYFPNSELPMRADLFNRVAWQLRTRAGVNVYAWLPLLAFELPNKQLEHRLAVKTFNKNSDKPTIPKYHRLSPFMPESAQIVGKIYADLGKYAPCIAGVLIHDDAYLAEDEDATACDPAARWPGTDRKLTDCHLTPRQKTQALIDFGDIAVRRLKHYVNLSTGFKVARNLYARVVLDPSAEARFAQALGPFVKHYDEVALMAMPYLDGTDLEPDKWFDDLVNQVNKVPGARKEVVYELQTKDWRTGEWIPGDTLRHLMILLIRKGAVNLGYYPDDFLNNEPPFLPTFEGMSLNQFPHYEVHP